MGIPGILKEIGKGERVALAKLAVEHLERSQRPLRIAIDAAIWNFQTQAGQGGKNPALRTLFYRLVKLLALPIDPVFVYDGKNKPLTKRGRTVARYGSCISNEMSKRLVRAFRFPHHTAPGEAEAECAMLQRTGVVDAVMSQDVDAIMFGSTVTLRDWSKEASKHNKSPTHVSVLDVARIESVSGLDPAGMVLVALLSGGDYDEAGVAGIGATLACEIARAGFGRDLLELVRQQDDDGLREWRDRLQFELESNESGYFKIKRKAIRVPDEFPDRQILQYYLNPAVTPEHDLPRLEHAWSQEWRADIDVPALRTYVGDWFEWLHKPGAWKFVRVMAPSLLANALQRDRATAYIQSADQFTERRRHFVSDGIPELRVTVVPADVVGIDLAAEPDSPEYLDRLAAEEDDGTSVAESASVPDGGQEEPPASQSKKRKTTVWSPYQPEKMWLPETLVERGARRHVEEWRDTQREMANDPIAFATRKCPKNKDASKVKATGGMQAGAILNFMVATKPVHTMTQSDDPGPKVSRPRRRPGAETSSDEPAPPAPSTTQSRPGGPMPAPSPTAQAARRRPDHLSSSLTAVYSTTKATSLTDVFSTAKSRLNAVEFKSHAHGTSVHEPIMLSSSPMFPRDKAREAMEAEEAAADVDTDPVPSSVTRRKSQRRAKRIDLSTDHDAARAGAQSQTDGGSPARPKRTIESYFRRYMTAPPPQAPSGTSALAVRAKPSPVAAIPPDPSTGLRTSFSSRHVHAVPRESLPGTWKVMEGEWPDGDAEGRRGSGVTATRASGTRVSLVDLTGG